MKNIIKSIFFVTIIVLYNVNSFGAGETAKLLNPGWSFKGFFGTFDRASLQRGYQVYSEV